MLTAISGSGQLINLVKDGLPQKQPFYCPACRQPMRLRNGKIKRPHFAHLTLDDCHFYQENESAEHLGLKAKLFQNLSLVQQVEIERVLPQIHQIADLLINQQLAIEVQCSPLSKERLKERTDSYRQSGIFVLWLLGEKLWLKKRLTALQRQFLYFSKNLGFHLWELDLKRNQLRLHYLIHEDWKGQVHYLSRQVSLDGDIWSLLHFPYRSQKMARLDVVMDTDLLTYIRRQIGYQSPRWHHLQAEAYRKGDNLLTKDLAYFYPQVRPVASKDGFAQISHDLSSYQAHFMAYYQRQGSQKVQILYPPAFYDKMEKIKMNKGEN